MKSKYYPLVSIVIPAYNEEKCIVDAIYALMKQTYRNIEVIIVDNNSTDRTVARVRHYLALNYIKLVHEPRQGLIFARQCGLDNATGEIIAQLDADCVPPRDWIEKAVKHFTDPNVSGVTGPYDYYDASWYMRWFTSINQHVFFGLASWFVQWRKTGAVLIGGNSFIRTVSLKVTGGYNMNLHFYGEDTDTAKRIAKHGKVLFSHKLVMPTSARRFHKLGFWKVIITYFKVFLTIVRGKELAPEQTHEGESPR